MFVLSCGSSVAPFVVWLLGHWICYLCRSCCEITLFWLTVLRFSVFPLCFPVLFVTQALQDHEDLLLKVRERLANPPQSFLPDDPVKVPHR